MSKKAWDVIKEETLLSYHIFDVKKSLRVNPQTKHEIEFLLVRGLDWVNVLCLTEKDEVVLVKQYRPGIEAFTLELPGGCIEKGEDPEIAAKRELIEETGFHSDNLEFIGVVQANPAMYSMKNYFYVARNCKLTSLQNLDEGEDVDIAIMPYTQLIEEVKSGKFNHGLCTAAIGLYELKK